MENQHTKTLSRVMKSSLANFVSYIMLPICKGDASEDESPRPDVRNDSDSSYLGDVESLSCDSAEPSSDSEGEMFSKGDITKRLLKLIICPPKLVLNSRCHAVDSGFLVSGTCIPGSNR